MTLDGLAVAPSRRSARLSSRAHSSVHSSFRASKSSSASSSVLGAASKRRERTLSDLSEELAIDSSGILDSLLTAILETRHGRAAEFLLSRVETLSFDALP